METSKRSVGILTFHASHNYGSMLQAHALQYVVVKLGYTCEIINFRKKEQLKMYAPIHKRGSLLQRLVRTVTLFPYLKGCNEKYRLFEEFMQQYMNLSPDIYHTLEDVEKAGLQYDYYITGSDQIWNPICWDFDWVYFLPFVEKGKKIAEILQTCLVEELKPAKTRTAKSNDNYYLLKNVPCPIVIVECGFLSNWEEAELLCTEAYQKRVADAVARGILEYLDSVP